MPVRFSGGRVTHASRVTDSRGAEYHTYHIAVDVETDAAGENIRRLTVCRRFSDFSALDAALRARLPPSALAHLPALPTSLIFNKFSDSVVSARRASLDKYVQALLTANVNLSAPLTELPEVLGFFGGLSSIPEHDPDLHEDGEQPAEQPADD